MSSSIDAEGLFEFEGIDEPLPFNSKTEYDSDKEDDEMGSSTPRPRAGSAKSSLAKSLPISIPTFLSEARNGSKEDLDEDVS